MSMNCSSLHVVESGEQMGMPKMVVSQSAYATYIGQQGHIDGPYKADWPDSTWFAGWQVQGNQYCTKPLNYLLPPTTSAPLVH